MNASTYFVLGMVAGLLLVIEGMSLRRSGGRLSALVAVITLLEIGWLILCIFALFNVELPGWTGLIPAAYLGYFLMAAWQYGRVGGLDDMKDLSDIKVPVSFAAVEIYFGVGLLAMCALAWAQFAEQLASAT